MNQILFSIIIPFYNAESTLERALESCVNQTYKNIEIICVDDCSDDNSVFVVEKYKSCYGENIRYRRLENRSGPGTSRNCGIDLANGQFLIFLDSDDYLSINLCCKLYKKIQEEEPDILYYNFICVDGEKERTVELISYEDASYWYKNNTNGVWLHCIRKQIIVDSHLYMPPLIFGEDSAVTPLWRLSAKKKVKIEEALYYHVEEKKSIVHNIKEEYIEQLICNVVLYRNGLLSGLVPNVNVKAEKDAMMARDISVGLKNLSKLNVTDLKYRLQQLREKLTISDKYEIDTQIAVYELPQLDIFLVESFVKADYKRLILLMEEIRHLDCFYIHGYSDKVNCRLDEQLRRLDKEVVIWGINEKACALYRNIEGLGYKVSLVDSKKAGSIRLGEKNIEVLLPIQIFDKKNFVVLVMSTAYYYEIKMSALNVSADILVINGLEWLSHLIEPNNMLWL